jgi:FkbM family methyltransferase
MSALVRLARRALERRSLAPLFRDPLSGARVYPLRRLERLGSAYGGWIVPTGLLPPGAVCYCVGVGEDVTFDLALVRRLGCAVFAYDPTPRAAAHVAGEVSPADRYRFVPVGVWDREETVRFYAPADPQHVSHSIVNLQRTDAYFVAPCRRLGGLMRENGHAAIDLLKLDVEGAEYRVLDSLMEDGLRIGIVCVEYDEGHHPLDGGFRPRIAGSVRRLIEYGYRVVAVEDGYKYTLVHGTLGFSGVLKAVVARLHLAAAAAP